MSLLDTFIPAENYNDLPHISENFNVPDEHREDLEYFRNLLVQYGMPGNVGVRLIHKHFDAHEGEILCVKTVETPSFGKIKTMRPMLAMSHDGTRFFPIHFLVDKSGNIQAYEYSDTKPQIPASEEFQAFLTAFSNFIIARGLQQLFGLKIDCPSDDTTTAKQSPNCHKLETYPDDPTNTSVTEFEYPEMRGTILIPHGLPMPEGDYVVTVTTEWYGVPFRQGPGCEHKESTRVCAHCVHCRNHQQTNPGVERTDLEGLLSFGGHTIEEGTPFHHLMTQLIEGW